MTPERSSGPLQKLTASFAALACLSGAPACKDDAEKKAPDAEAAALTISHTQTSAKICLDSADPNITPFVDKTKFFDVNVTRNGVKFCVEFVLAKPDTSSWPTPKPETSANKLERQKNEKALAEASAAVARAGHITKLTPEEKAALVKEFEDKLSKKQKELKDQRAMEHGFKYEFKTFEEAIEDGDVISKKIIGGNPKPGYKFFDDHPDVLNYYVIPESDPTYLELIEQKKEKSQNPVSTTPEL